VGKAQEKCSGKTNCFYSSKKKSFYLKEEEIKLTNGKQKDLSMKPVMAAYKAGENIANAAMKGTDNLIKGAKAGFSKSFHKKR